MASNRKQPNHKHASPFRFRAYWFLLAQTEEEDTPIPPIPSFDLDTALLRAEHQAHVI
jgi:hypothetical protein